MVEDSGLVRAGGEICTSGKIINVFKEAWLEVGAAGPTFNPNNTSTEGSRLLGEDVLQPFAEETRET